MAESSYPTAEVRGRSQEDPCLKGGSQEELPHARGQGQPGGATLRLMPEAVAAGSNPTSKEQWLHRCRRAKRSYSTFKVRRGSREDIHFFQGKQQLLCFLEQP